MDLIWTLKSLILASDVMFVIKGMVELPPTSDGGGFTPKPEKLETSKLVHMDNLTRRIRIWGHFKISTSIYDLRTSFHGFLKPFIFISYDISNHM